MAMVSVQLSESFSPWLVTSFLPWVSESTPLDDCPWWGWVRVGWKFTMMNSGRNETEVGMVSIGIKITFTLWELT